MSDDVIDEFLRVRAKSQRLVQKFLENKMQDEEALPPLTSQREKKKKYPFGHPGYGHTGYGGAYSGFPYTLPYYLG